MVMAGPPSDAFYIDEEPLRRIVVKGYFGEKTVPMDPVPLIARLRDLLSGPPGGESELSSYFFETDPEGVVPAFLQGIESQTPGISALVAGPILAAAEELARAERREIAPNLAVFISSLAGPAAVKAGIPEAVAAALLAGFLILAGRLGPKRVRKLYGNPT